MQMAKTALHNHLIKKFSLVDFLQGQVFVNTDIFI